MAAEIPDGAVIVARAILNSSLWTMRPVDRCVAMTCICLCNFTDRKWFDGEKEILIRRGQFVRGRKEFAKAAGVTEQALRTAIKHLEKTRDNDGVPFLTKKSTSGYTLFTLPKYDYYQDLTNYSDFVRSKPTSHLTSTQPGPNQPLTKGQPRSNHKQEGEQGEEGKKRKEGGAAASATPAPAAAPHLRAPAKSRQDLVTQMLAEVESMTPAVARHAVEFDMKLYRGTHPYPEVFEAKKKKAADDGGKKS